ncbi:MAG: cysteate synthase [Spirochaeta sp.]|jgi:cysteate synthase|nr:cysteate synthase [Spirochaeta sp.]
MSSIARERVSAKTDAHYHLRCLATGTVVHDVHSAAARPATFPLNAPAVQLRERSVAPPPPAFLRTHYAVRDFSPDPLRTDIFRYRSWLPVSCVLDGAGGPVTFHSRGYGASLGLENLYVTFSGWWPERGAAIPTGTFKENEAYTVYGRMADAAHSNTLVVASAGNTARAFLRVASAHDLPLVVVIPARNVPDLWTVGPRSSSTVVIAVGDDADYTDAIRLAALLTENSDFLAEGGAKNVARRDGMGTTFLSAAEAMGRIPDHYIQAVGSGTGAIAAWEANLRLLDAGHPGPSGLRGRPGCAGGVAGRARLHLAQNAPFQLLVDSWKERSRTLCDLDETTAKHQIDAIDAKVLANRHPPWSPIGGLFDALTDTDGAMYGVDTPAAHTAGTRFEADEDIDLAPASRVACAALEQAVRDGAIAPDEYVSLNITGGGYRRARQDLDTHPLVPDVTVGKDHFSSTAIGDTVRKIIAARAERRKNTRGERTDVT